MDGSDVPSSGRDARGPFLAGNPGLPVGSRGRTSRRAARAVLLEFEGEMDQLLPRMRRWLLPQYAALVGLLAPGLEAAGGELGGDDEIETARVVADVRAALAKAGAGEAALAELESAMQSERRLH